MEWKYKLNLKDLFDDYSENKLTVNQVSKEVSNRIKQLPCYNEYESLKIFAERFEDISNDNAEDYLVIRDFDYEMDCLYDWGDIKEYKDFAWYKRCWISTVI